MGRHGVDIKRYPPFTQLRPPGRGRADYEAWKHQLLWAHFRYLLKPPPKAQPMRKARSLVYRYKDPQPQPRHPHIRRRRTVDQLNKEIARRQEVQATQDAQKSHRRLAAPAVPARRRRTKGPAKSNILEEEPASAPMHGTLKFAKRPYGKRGSDEPYAPQRTTIAQPKGLTPKRALMLNQPNPSENMSKKNRENHRDVETTLCVKPRGPTLRRKIHLRPRPNANIAKGPALPSNEVHPQLLIGQLSESPKPNLAHQALPLAKVPKEPSNNTSHQCLSSRNQPQLRHNATPGQDIPFKPHHHDKPCTPGHVPKSPSNKAEVASARPSLHPRTLAMSTKSAPATPHLQ